MPHGEKITLDELEAKIYKHVMSYREDPTSFANALLSVERDIEKGNLLVRKDLVELIIGSLSKEVKEELLEAIYNIRLETMKRVGTRVMLGKTLKNSGGITYIYSYDKFMKLAGGVLIRDYYAADYIQHIDNVAKILGFDKKVFKDKANAWIDSVAINGGSWVKAKDAADYALGLSCAMQIDEEIDKDVMVEIPENRTDYCVFYFNPEQFDFIKKYLDSDKENRQKIFEEMKGYSIEAQGLLQEFKSYSDKIPSKFLARLEFMAKLADNTKETYENVIDAVYAKYNDQMLFAEYREKLRGIDPSLDKLVDKVMAYSKKVSDAIFNHIKNGNIVRDYKMGSMNNTVSRIEDKLKEKDINKQKTEYKKQLDGFLKRRKEREEKLKADELNTQQKIADAKSKRKESDIILEKVQALDNDNVIINDVEKVSESKHLGKDDTQKYFEYLELAFEYSDFKVFPELIKCIHDATTPYIKEAEIRSFRKKTADLAAEISEKAKDISFKNINKEKREKAYAEAKESYKDKRTEWINSLRDMMGKYNDIGLSEKVFLRSFNVVLARVPKDKVKQDDKQADICKVEVAEGANKNNYREERRSFAETVLDYINEAVNQSGNSFIRPVQEVSGEKNTIMHILSRLKNKLLEEIPTLKNAGDFPVPDDKKIEEEGVKVYLKELDKFLLSNLKNEEDYDRLKVVESSVKFDRSNLDFARRLEQDLKELVMELRKEDRPFDFKKYVVDRFRGRLVEEGVDLDSSVRMINSITELELWCQDVAVAINKAVIYGRADDEKVLKICDGYTNSYHFGATRSGYTKDWMKNPPVKAERKDKYDEDTDNWSKEDLAATNNMHNANYLQKTFKITEFISKKYEKDILFKYIDAGYDKQVTRWFICKKIFIYAMGVHNKSLEDIAKMTAEEKAEMGRLFANDISKHPFDGGDIRDLSAENLIKNVEWYGKMYGQFYKSIYNESMNLFDAGSADELSKLQDYNNSKLCGIDTLLTELDNEGDIYSLIGENAANADQFNVHGVDRLDSFTEGFDSVMGKGSYNDAIELRNRVDSFVNIYGGMKLTILSPIAQLICKLIVQYEIEPKLAGKDLKAGDAETTKLIDEVSENISRAYAVISEKLDDLVENMTYTRNGDTLKISDKDAKSFFDSEKFSVEYIEKGIKNNMSGDLQYQAIIGFIAKYIPGTPEIVKYYAQLPEGLKDEMIQKAVKGGYPEDIKAETEAGKKMKEIQDAEEREKARLAEIERKKQEDIQKKKDIEARNARISELENALVPRAKVFVEKAEEDWKNIDPQTQKNELIENSKKLVEKYNDYFAFRRELSHLKSERDYSDDFDRIMYEKALANVMEIRDKRSILTDYRDYIDDNTFQLNILTSLGEEYTALSNLRRTDYFYQERERVYKVCLEAVLKNKGVNINDKKAEDTKVTVEEIMIQKEKLFTKDEYRIFDESDMRIEMENRLIKDNEVATEISEMLDDIYHYRNELGGSKKYKDTDKPRMPKKFSPGQIDKEMMPQNMRDMQAAAALRKGIDVKGRDAADYESTYETSCIFLDQLRKLALHQNYFEKLFMADDIKIKEELKRSFKDKNLSKDERRTANSMYMDSYKAMNYMTQFFPHYGDNGPRYYAEHVIPGILKNLTEQYRRAKKEGTQKAMLDFYKSIDGACFDYIADNIRNFASAHPINNVEKEIYALPDPGHGGVYIHDSRFLDAIIFYDKMSDEKGDTLFNAAAKLINALTQENNNKLYRWDEVEKEIIYQLAGKHLKDADFTDFSPEDLYNDENAEKLFADLKKKCIDMLIIEEDPQIIQEKEDNQGEIAVPEKKDEKADLLKQVDDFNNGMKKAYEDMRVIASENAYTLPRLGESYWFDGFRIKDISREKKEKIVELYDKIFDNYSKKMNLKSYNFTYNKTRKFGDKIFNFDEEIKFEDCFFITDTRKNKTDRPGEIIDILNDGELNNYSDDDKKIMIMYALTEPRFKVSFTPLKATFKEIKDGKYGIDVEFDQPFEVPTFKDENFIRKEQEADYLHRLLSTKYERAFKMELLGDEQEQNDMLAYIYGNDAENHHPYDIRELFFAWILNNPEVTTFENFCHALLFEKEEAKKQIAVFKKEIMANHFDWQKEWFINLFGNAFKKVSEITLYKYRDRYSDSIDLNAAKDLVSEYDLALQTAVKLFGTVIPYKKGSSDYNEFVASVEKVYGKKNLFKHVDQINFIYECHKKTINPFLTPQERMVNSVVGQFLRRPFEDQAWDRDIFDAEKVRKEMKKVDMSAFSDEECMQIVEKGFSSISEERRNLILGNLAFMLPSAKPIVEAAPKIIEPVNVNKGNDKARPRKKFFVDKPAKIEEKKPVKEEVKEPVKEEVKEPVKEEEKEPVKEEEKKPVKEEVKEPVKVEVEIPVKVEVEVPVNVVEQLKEEKQVEIKEENQVVEPVKEEKQVEIKEEIQVVEPVEVVEPVKEQPVKVEAKPEKEKPVEEKPVEEKPVEEKPEKEKPVKEKPEKEKPVKEKPVEEKPVKDELFKKPKNLEEQGRFNKEIYKCINKLIGTDFKKLFAEKNMKLPGAIDLNDPSKLTEQDFLMVDAMFDVAFGEIAATQKYFKKDFLNCFRIAQNEQEKRSVIEIVKASLQKLNNAKASDDKYINSAAKLQILQALFNDNLRVEFTPRLFDSESVGKSVVDSTSCKLFINGKYGVKRPVWVSFKKKIDKLNKENHDSIFNLTVNKYEMHKKEFALELLTMEDLKEAENEFNKIFGGEIDNDYVNPNKFSSFLVVENGKEETVWKKCIDIRNAFRERAKRYNPKNPSSDPALSNMDSNLRYYLSDVKNGSSKKQNDIKAKVAKAYILYALGNKKFKIKVKNDALNGDVTIKTQKMNEEQKTAFQRDEKIYNYKLEADERVKQDKGRFDTLSINKKFAYDEIFDYPNEVIKKFKQAGFNNGENASGFYILFCVGYLGKSIDDLIKASPEQKKEFGRQFIDAIKNHSIGTEPEVGLDREKVKKNVKWYGDLFLNAVRNIAKENLTMPTEKTFTNLSTAEEYVASKNWVMALINDALNNVGTKNILSTDPNMDIMFDQSEDLKKEFRDACAAISKAGPVRNVFNGMLNPAFSIKFRAYQKIVGEMEVARFTRKARAIEKDINNVDDIVNGVKDLDKITALDWNSVLAAEEKMSGFSDEELNLIMNNSVDSLVKNHPELVLKVIDAICGGDDEYLYKNINKANSIMNMACENDEDRINHLTAALAVVTFEEHDAEELYKLDICSVVNLYSEKLKYENTKPEDLNQAAKVFDNIFGDNVNLEKFLNRNERMDKRTKLSSEVDEIFDNIDAGNAISEDERIQFKKAYILHGIMRNGVGYGDNGDCYWIKAPVKSENRKQQEAEYAEQQRIKIQQENEKKAAIKEVEDAFIAPYQRIIDEIGKLDLSEIYLLKINRPNKLNNVMDLEDFQNMSEEELDKCDRLFDKIFGNLIKQQKPLYKRYRNPNKKPDIYQELFYPTGGYHDFRRLMNDDGEFVADWVNKKNYEKFQKASILHALARTDGELDISRFSCKVSDFEKKKLVVDKTERVKILNRPDATVEVIQQIAVLNEDDNNMNTARETALSSIELKTGRHINREYIPNDIMNSLVNPPTGSSNEVAKNYVALSYIFKVYDKDITLQGLQTLNTFINSRDFKTEISNLQNNVVFKAVKKETDDYNKKETDQFNKVNPKGKNKKGKDKKDKADKDQNLIIENQVNIVQEPVLKNALDEWHQVEIDSEKIRQEYLQDLDVYSTDSNSLGDFVMHGFPEKNILDIDLIPVDINNDDIIKIPDEYDEYELEGERSEKADDGGMKEKADDGGMKEKADDGGMKEKADDDKKSETYGLNGMPEKDIDKKSETYGLNGMPEKEYIDEPKEKSNEESKEESNQEMNISYNNLDRRKNDNSLDGIEVAEDNKNITANDKNAKKKADGKNAKKKADGKNAKKKSAGKDSEEKKISLEDLTEKLNQEENANNERNLKYQRLASLITAQILSDKANIKLIQGFVTGHFDLMTVAEKTVDYLKRNNVLGDGKKKVDIKELNTKLANGTYKRNVLKDVMNKEKTIDRVKEAEKNAKALKEAEKNAKAVKDDSMIDDGKKENLITIKN